MTSPTSIYIPIGLTYKDYRAEYFAAYIDNGSGVCLCKPDCFPTDYKQDLLPIKGKDISDQIITMNTGIENPIILLGHFLIKCPPFYFHYTGNDILLGNNFLQLFHKVIYDTLLYQITFKTPCHHLIVVQRLKNAYGKRLPIRFIPRTDKRGDIGFTNRPIFPKGTPLLKYQKDTQLRIDQTITKLKECFSDNPLQFWDKNRIEARLELKEKDKLIRVTPMRYSPDDQIEFRKQLKELLDLKLIRASHSPHSSPAFMVRNHAEIVRNKPRMVINYKKLNDSTIFDGYFLPHKESLINWTGNKLIFSKFDCKSGFWQIKMNEDSIPYTAFSTPQGHYEWLVMPFGLKNAPQIFQRKMDNIFKDYDFIFVYIDDILVLSKDEETHIKHLDIFADLCKQNGLALSEKKSKIMQKEIEFLGMEIDGKGIKLQSHILEKIADFPDTLKDKKQVQSFLGVLNYATDFIQNLASLRKPFSDLLKKDRIFSFNDTLVKQVKLIKERCKNLPKLNLPSDKDNLILETDASELQWSGVLKKIDYNTENEKIGESLCRYCSGTFSDTQTRYHINEKELLAVVNSCQKLYYFLLPKRFLLRTDNTQVKAFIRNDLPSKPEYKRYIRWQTLLAEYSFDIEIIRSNKNVLADFLTRDGRTCGKDIEQLS